jgi:endonuclease YncB( thermonuclease family)
MQLLTILIAAYAIIFFCPEPLFAADFTGQVVGVIDGVSIRVMHNGRAEEIRLNSIDCPEKSQAYGKKAKQATSEFVFGKEVTVNTTGKDRYGRTLASVMLPGERNLNHELVKEGWCWWYRKYASADTVLEGLEKEAREAKKGLWADPQPVPPWVYRKARRGQTLDLSDLVPLDAETEGNTSTRGPPLLGAVESDSPTATSAYPIIGNRKSHIYHHPDCANYSQVAPRNRVRFNSAAEAEAAGYRVAGNCP